uniref:sensor histidine kinase n=1 Tax=Agathobacter sp. TaxID=2021311 RepID=UPI004055F268
MDIGVITAILLSLFAYETIAVMGIHQATAAIFGTIFFIYCKVRFKESFMQTGINIIFVYIIATICQFIGVVFTYIIIPENEALRAVCVNGEVLLFNIFILPKFRPDNIKNNINFKNIYTIAALFIVGGSVFLLLLQGKVFNGIRADSFILLIPPIIMLIAVLGKWNSSQKILQQMKKEKDSNAHMQQRYDDLLKEVRIRQHEFKNHMAAIFSAHYTYKTYEQLVDAQKEYCNKLVQENKYNNLLLIGNNILAGFLYEKFQQMEGDQICFTYKVSAKFENLFMPMYHLIEVIGILIDNAVEAVKMMEERKIYIEASEDETACYFTIRNIYKYVPYSEIGQWFQMGNSSKGRGRGIGLFHVKSLCEEWKCDIICENISIEGKNWIQFTIVMNKTDNQG